MTTELLQFVSEPQWRRSVSARLGEPALLPTTTVAAINTDYPAADWEGCIVYVSDGAANKFAAISNGTAWYYLQGTAV